MKNLLIRHMCTLLQDCPPRDEPDPIFSGPGRTGAGPDFGGFSRAGFRRSGPVPDRTPDRTKFRTYFTKMSQNQWKFLYGNKGLM